MGQVLMRFPGGRQRALTLSYDDGVEQDVKLIGIMKEYGLKGTFNLNSGAYATEGTVYPAGHIHRRMTKKQVGELYLSSGMEVASVFAGASSRPVCAGSAERPGELGGAVWLYRAGDGIPVRHLQR